MGLIYSKSESQNLIRVMEGNLAKAGSILQSLTQASKQLTSVLTVELKGQAYSSGLAVFDDIILPTMQHASTAIEELSQGLSSYRALDSAMPNEILDEDNLNEQIRIRQNMVSSLHHQSRLLQYQQGGDDLVSHTNLLHHLTSHMLVLEEEIRQLQEKVRKLGEFSSSTSGLFTAGQNYLLASLRGVNILKHTTVDPQTGAYLLRGGVSLLDLQVQGVGDDFQSKLQKMTLAEIEEKYGNIIRVNVNSVYIGAGFDSRYAGTKLSPKEIDAIRAHYQYLKARGDLTLQQIKNLQTMYANLKATDKEAIDSMNLEELTSKYSYLLLPRLGMDIPYALADPSGKAKKDYLYHRFEELMAQELIDWRDPQYMEKLNAYVNETGLDPRTGLEASDDVKLVAKHYGWVKGSSTLAASLISAKIDFDEMMVANHTGNKNYRSQDDLLGSFEDFMSPEDAKRYADWNDFVEAGIEPEARLRIMDEGIFSPKTYVEFSAANPTQNVDDYIELVRGQSPWPKGYTPKKVVLKPGDTFEMAMHPDQDDFRPGNFGTDMNSIQNIDYVRDNLAVKSNWKDKIDRVNQYRVKDGVELPAQVGPIGPQIDLGTDRYLPGGPNQIELLLDRAINKMEYLELIGQRPID